ncbi:CaiB/BaiF CoA transferase family protein [Mycobacterium intracellulare]|uniref:CaiB/BaiF CoA transferase family protein n=1 Tax=Mycobacterium intracellulare TaxID=1767 RepID=UPI00080BEC5C|nr:CaiB/BaiF CoA-transferase family protein [Mycobacterium intracellulare]OCB07068.1 carnitine dehydratase [Mycobacterium intracellulare subsp. yongonense]
MSGPLAGVRVVELAGIGPTPHAAMLLADWGADVIRLVRPTAAGSPADAFNDTQLRNRTLIAANLKDPAQVAVTLDLIERADVLIEGFRPGVTERLGLGPAECLARNPKLIYARMTGWGQQGPWARSAGHDLNYLAVTGVLSTIGTAEDPVVPLNLLGDFGGGSMFLVAGILAALHERYTSGRGQVIDAAIVDGISQLAHTIWSFRHQGMWDEQRSSNIVDGGTPWYAVYRCADGRHVAVAALEDPFYTALLDGLGLDPDQIPHRADRASWPRLRSLFADTFATKPRDHWAERFDGSDACVTPVLTLTEALAHPHLQDRGVLKRSHDAVQPAPAPRFGRSGCASHRPPGSVIGDLTDQLQAWSV